MKDLIENPKIASIVGAGTTGAGIGTVTSALPVTVGLIASLTGIILSLFILYRNITTGTLERKKIRLEIEHLEERKRKRNPENPLA